jgi:hypothetical protein
MMDLWQHRKRSGPEQRHTRETEVAPVEEKLMQYRLRWFGHIQRRSAEAPVRSGVIRRSSNDKRGRGRPNLTWEVFVRRDLIDWYINKELALDKIE